MVGVEGEEEEEEEEEGEEERGLIIAESKTIAISFMINWEVWTSKIIIFQVYVKDVKVFWQLTFFTL